MLSKTLYFLEAHFLFLLSVGDWLLLQQPNPCIIKECIKTIYPIQNNNKSIIIIINIIIIIDTTITIIILIF